MTGQCELCGAAFESKQANARFCCEAHRAKAESRRRRTPSVEATCAYCGRTFLASQAHLSQSAQRGVPVVCSFSCRTAYGNALRYGWPTSPVKYGTCAECGAVFVKRNTAKLCSDECRTAHHRTHRRAYDEQHGVVRDEGLPPGEYVCLECGKRFTTTRWHAKKLYCSDRCARAEANRLDQHKRRALARDESAASPAQVRAKRVAANGHCHWCGKRAKKLTIDHVVPVSRGGTNEIDNLVFACFDCNCKGKRDRLPNAEWTPEDKHGQKMLCLV